jgi:predicted amidohydrolase
MQRFIGFLIVTLGTSITSAQPPLPDSTLPEGWHACSPRDEIRPTFSHRIADGASRNGMFVITTGDAVEQHGWVQKSFPVIGGKTYMIQVNRRTENVATPRRSTPVRIVWQDANGRPVLADVPAGREKEGGPVPLAEPEHPLDGKTDDCGTTSITGTYRAPSRAKQAIVELHLQWAPKGRVEWTHFRFENVEPVAPRKVRLGTIHYRPTGKSPAGNCEEFAPLIGQAAKERCDLVVLGETVHYVGVGKKPHEVAEPVPGPSTQYFCDQAKQHKLHIVVSLYERAGKEVYNVALLIGPDGAMIGKYRKVCLPHSEVEAGVTPGSDYPVFDTKLGKIGMMICYDGFFPEVARELTAGGAEVIAWPVWGCNPLLGQARACENHVYVVSSTYTDSQSNWMISAVFDHAGKPIAKAAKWGTVAVAEIDLSERHFWRNNLGDFRAMAQRHRPPAKSDASVSTPKP